MYSHAIPHVEMTLRAFELLPPDQIARMAKEDAYFRMVVFENHELRELKNGSVLASKGLYTHEYSTRPHFATVAAEPEIVAFSTGNRLFATASTGYRRRFRPTEEIRVDVFDTATGRHERGHVVDIPEGSDLHAIHFASDAKSVSVVTKSYGEMRVSVIDTNSGETLRKFEFKANPVKNCFSADGLDVLYTQKPEVSYWPEKFPPLYTQKPALSYINVATGERTGMFFHDVPVLAGAFSPDKLRIASGAKDGIVRVWEKATGTLIHTLSLAPDPTEVLKEVLAVAFAPDNIHVAAVYSIGKIRIWNIETQKVVRTFEGSSVYQYFGAGLPDVGHLHRYASDFPEVAFSPNGATLALDWGKGKLQIFNPFSESAELTLQGGKVAEYSTDKNSGHTAGFAFSEYGDLAWVAHRASRTRPASI